jgi:hypothetical protein
MKRRRHHAVRSLLPMLAATFVLAGAGCGRHPATAEDCQAILDRLIDLELAESGFHDPVLAGRWQADVRRRFVPELRACRAFRVRNDLRGCLAGAANPEELTHRCLD